MAKLTTFQQFGTVAQIKEHYKLILPKPYDWRLIVPNLVGQIHALPGSRGVAVATNGIIVAIVQTDGLFLGHMENFIPDDEQPVEVVKEVKAKKPTSGRKQKVDISEFI
jgi:hypothetical protein